MTCYPLTAEPVISVSESEDKTGQGYAEAVWRGVAGSAGVHELRSLGFGHPAAGHQDLR